MATGNLFNPTGVSGSQGSQEDYAIGDLSGKHGKLQFFGSFFTMWDTNLPLFGPNSVVHRSIVFYRLGYTFLKYFKVNICLKSFKLCLCLAQNFLVQDN